AIFGAGLMLGVAIAMVMKFLAQISFNAEVIMGEDQSIVAYSNAIRDIGICKKPAGETYSEEELKNCNPNNVDASSVPGTLRSDVLQTLAASSALNSVPKESLTGCMNPKTKKNYTYEEMEDLYAEATTAEELVAASDLIQGCSALRIIPDALPAFKNEEALLASLNKIFIDSGWEPESLSPMEESAISENGINLNTLSVRLSVEADVGTTRTVLNNIEHSIREFDIQRATIEWASNNTLVLQATANAYYMTPSNIIEGTTTIKAGGN
ncbi:hypothetical protein IJ135_00400, partial [Candidatus Saccharibacteria bacterium]|nr:hypothetical protein [Candidatus Saccharibacteria bacterium]